MRTEVTFRSGDDDVAAWWYAGTGESPAPVVVMAHGFSLTRHDGLAAYAEAFASAGAHVLVFDHRYLGDSGGTPRQRFRTGEQREDWRNALAFVRSRPDVDPARVVLWGYSFSGGHVASLVTGGADVAAAMILCPFVNGLARVLRTPPRDLVWIVPRAAADLAGRHVTVPVTAQPRSPGAMTRQGEADGFAAAVPEGSPWRNEISPGSLLTLPLVRPVARAGRVGVPVWVGRCADDITVDGRSVARFAKRAPRGELHDYPGAHFAPFVGAGVAPIVADQVDFLRRTVLSS